MPDTTPDPDWAVVVLDVAECGCCPIDTEAATLTLQFVKDMEYDEDTEAARMTIDVVYNAFKWQNQKGT